MPDKISLSADTKVLAKARAAERGCRTIDQYIQTLIREDGPVPVSAELEAHLMKSLKGGTRRATPGFWAEKRRKLRRQHAG